MREIRTAQISDLEAIEALYLHLNPERPVMDQHRSQLILNRLIEMDEFQLLLCFADSILVASSMLIFAPNLMRGGRPHALLENVVTHKDYRQSGHGQAVINAAFDLAWERGAHQVLLFSARVDPGAHEFYEKCGFRGGRKAGYVMQSPSGD